MYNYLKAEDDGLPMRPSGPWALDKLDYLARYIDVFETAMRGHWRQRNYIDLLAGPGKNRVRNTDTVFLGSPLLALTTRYPFTGFHFVEFDHQNHLALAERCRAWSGGGVHLYEDDCNRAVDSIVADLKRWEDHSLNLAFLDPEGLELHWTTVARLASVKRMDLIINYPEGGLNRLMRLAVAQDEESPVDRFFGNRNWRAIYLAWTRQPTSSVHRPLIDLYKRQLETLGYRDVRRDDEVGAEPLMRNQKRKAPLYRLLFASKNPLGDDFWRKITRRDPHGQARLFEAPLQF